MTPETPGGRGQMRLLVSLIVALVLLAAPALASAAVSSAGGNDDPSDTPSSPMDVSYLRADHDSETGTMTVTATFSRALPPAGNYSWKTYSSSSSSLPPYLYIHAMTAGSGCAYSTAANEKKGALTVSVDLPDGQVGKTYGTTQETDGGPTRPLDHVSAVIADDRMSITTTIADGALVSNAYGCIDLAASAGSAYDSVPGIPFGLIEQVGPDTRPPNELPACSQGDASATPEAKPVIPKHAALGRDAVVRFRTADGTFADVDLDVDALVAITKNGRTRFAVDKGSRWHLNVRRADRGKVRIDVVWAEEPEIDGRSYRCKRSATATTVVDDGAAPAIKLRRDDKDGVKFVIPVPRDCNAAAAGPVRITVTSRGQSRTSTLRDQCGNWKSELKMNRARDWSLMAFNGIADVDPPELWLGVWSTRTETQTFTWRATVNGRAFERGKIISKTRYKPGRRIWQGEDAFVNYCINEDKLIRSKGGVLYCDTPSVTHRAFRFLG